ncbi:hypothetical protein GOP47_0028046 [Adiantum capillus-veneris]|nr:hypothetical protein GOP47_0028046 [Adiantum capillus-veneris]
MMRRWLALADGGCSKEREGSLPLLAEDPLHNRMVNLVEQSGVGATVCPLMPFKQASGESAIEIMHPTDQHLSCAARNRIIEIDSKRYRKRSLY